MAPIHDRTTGASDSKQAADAQATGVQDRMRLSPDAQLLQTALVASTQAPDVRADVVERMRALLAEGKVGHDLARLADALIDNWTKTP
jgi:flagellar biosynthesis anti-sigma factor FlgM